MNKNILPDLWSFASWCFYAASLLTYLPLPWYTTSMVNASLHQAQFPDYQKHVIFVPMFKKLGLNTRYGQFPSGLQPDLHGKSCLSAAAWIPNRPQLSYRKQHSTETDVVRVISDVLTTTDDQQVMLIAMLDLSSAFDYVELLKFAILQYDKLQQWIWNIYWISLLNVKH